MSETLKKRKIMIVDDVRSNLRILVDTLKKEYRIVVAMNGYEAINLLDSLKEDLPEIILLDIMMPGIDGYEVCARLKADERLRHIPIIFLTALSETSDERKGIAIGAVDYITKPLRLPIVKARIAAQLELKSYRDSLEEMVKARTQEILKTQLEIVNRLAIAAEFRDNETGQHIKRLSHYCMLLACACGMDEERAQTFFHASAMHDVGKIGIPDAVLLKKGKLSEEEWEIMRSHTIIGAKILDDSNSKLLKVASKVALTHHERWDGSGYPNKLQGEDIIFEGRILAVCDVFDTLVSIRPYKSAWTPEDALGEIKEQRGKHFDPNIVDVFVAIFPNILEIWKKYND